MTKADTNIKKMVSDHLKKPYSRILIPEEDGGYSAEILEFPGCFSQGDTVDEAMQNIEGAAQNWIEATLEAGKPIPSPATDYEYAGKVALRLPRSIHRQAVRMAEKDGVSLNQWLASAIAARIGAEEICNRIAERAENSWLISKTLTADNRFSKVVALLKSWRQFSTGDDLEPQTMRAKFVYRSTSETVEVEG